MRFYTFGLLFVLSAVLLVNLASAQTPGQGNPQGRKSANPLILDTTETPSAILASNSKAVAVIVAANSESAKLGTGFFVGSSGLLLTNLHVIEGTTTVGIKLPGTQTVILATKVRAYDSDNDLVLLQVDGADAQPVALADSDKVYAGQAVVVIGTPEGLEQTVSNGLVSAIRDLNGRKLFQISAPISAGSSGSPVFNDHGEVIGVVVSSVEEGQNLNFAVPINFAKPLLKERTEQPISSLPKSKQLGTQAPGEAGAAGSAPTLKETLDWLVDKVGTAGYNRCSSDGKKMICEKWSYESVEAEDCKLTFTDVWEVGGVQTFRHSSTNTFSLRVGSPDISVDAITPSVMEPIGCRKNRPCQIFGDQEIFSVGRPGVLVVFFRSKDLADRVAKAMNHAIALCGKEPF